MPKLLASQHVQIHHNTPKYGFLSSGINMNVRVRTKKEYLPEIKQYKEHKWRLKE